MVAISLAPLLCFCGGLLIPVPGTPGPLLLPPCAIPWWPRRGCGLVARADIESAAAAPPPGAVYGVELAYPLVGKQRVTITVEDRRRVYLSMAGVVSYEGAVAYLVDPATLTVAFTLPRELLANMARYRVRLLDPTYDAGTDRAAITLVIPWLGVRRTVAMHRRQ